MKIAEQLLSYLVIENPIVHAQQHRTDFSYLENFYKDAAYAIENYFFEDMMDINYAIHFVLAHEYGTDNIIPNKLKTVQNKMAHIVNQDVDLSQGF